MKHVLRLSLLLIFLAEVGSGNAQVQSILDGAYVKETNLTKRVVPYPPLREADVIAPEFVKELTARFRAGAPLARFLCEALEVEF